MVIRILHYSLLFVILYLTYQDSSSLYGRLQSAVDMPTCLSSSAKRLQYWWRSKDRGDNINNPVLHDVIVTIFSFGSSFSLGITTTLYGARQGSKRITYEGLVNTYVHLNKQKKTHYGFLGSRPPLSSWPECLCIRIKHVGPNGCRMTNIISFNTYVQHW